MIFFWNDDGGDIGRTRFLWVSQTWGPMDEYDSGDATVREGEYDSGGCVGANCIRPSTGSWTNTLR